MDKHLAYFVGGNLATLIWGVHAFLWCLHMGGAGVAAVKRTAGGAGDVKVFPYSLPSVGPGADPGVQAVSPQVT